MFVGKLINYVALATIIAFIFSNAKNFEAKFRCGVPREQHQVDLIAGSKKITANRIFKSVVDRFEAMQQRAVIGDVYDRGKDTFRRMYVDFFRRDDAG